MAGVLAGLAMGLSASQAAERTIQEVDAVTTYALDRIRPATIIFSDHSHDTESPDGPAPGLITFAHWAKARPDEAQLLDLYPGHTQTTDNAAKSIRRGSGATQTIMYVAKARFILDRTPTLADLSRYATLSFVEHVDPAIKHKRIEPAEAGPLTKPRAAANRNPNRPWCIGRVVVCFRSHYQLEGKLPLGIRLANKVRDANKKIAEYLEFDSELAVRAPDELDLARLTKVTALDTPVIGALEQTTFYINQVLEFARSIVVFQPHPTAANKTVVTAFVAIALKSRLLDSKKEYAKVPVLRNLVPVQVLMGKSSFNTGESISGGLPIYARSRIRAIAGMLDKP
jgi:hypothetical protein